MCSLKGEKKAIINARNQKEREKKKEENPNFQMHLNNYIWKLLLRCINLIAS